MSEYEISCSSGGRPLSPKVINALAETVTDIFTGEGNLYGFTVYNAHSAAVFLQVFDDRAADVVLGTTVPKLSIPVPATGQVTIMSPIPLMHAGQPTSGISVALTAGATNNTAPGAAGHINAFYKN